MQGRNLDGKISSEFGQNWHNLGSFFAQSGLVVKLFLCVFPAKVKSIWVKKALVIYSKSFGRQIFLMKNNKKSFGRQFYFTTKVLYII